MLDKNSKAKKKYNKQGKTKTSSFGISGRYGHDSSEFYKGKLYGENKAAIKVKYFENEIPPEKIDRIYCKSSEKMDDIPDNSVHLMVTSPPYNAKKEYDNDLSLKEYLELLKNVFNETYKKLVPGGRACVNIANLGRKPYIPLHSYIIRDMIDIGYLMRGEVIWNKGSSAGGSCAWGSWQSASNPVLRDTHEYLLIFSKESFSRKKENKENTIKKEEFLEYTKSIWNFNSVSAKKVGHPAPFPEELPYRVIQMYTFKEDVILDPFCGSGTTCLAALKTERHFIGYDTEPEYFELSKKNIKEYTSQTKIGANNTWLNTVFTKNN